MEFPSSEMEGHMRHVYVAVVVLALVLGGGVLGPSGAGAQTVGWQHFGGDPGDTHWSALEQITTSNVRKLTPVWVLQLGTLRSQESTPLVIGFGGGEYGARGALQAFNADTGALVWRTYLTPEPGEPGSETWKGDSWKTGGGAAWAIGSYDPEQNLIFYGTSNPGPWNASVRGPDKSDYGRFTNLYTSASVALDGDTGKIAWHYQSTPHDAWDYDGVNELLVADLTIDGQKTPVVLKGDRNGFLYVINRKSGALISAKAFEYINWATGVDLSTGRPVENPEMRPRQGYRAKGVCPAAIGAKNWMPMALNPKTGILFMPTFNLCMDMEFVPQDYKRGAFYLAADFEIGKPGPGGFMGEAIAWDPAKQEAVWRNKERSE